ncbi:hypothetical protein QVD17_14827 [Tagetes erecta]|uniref:Protein kinase domain-containing protein n=1 Tax=Tagetes erecta TaxID=13708 RepID=A0AAD8KR67_TARER|nr:hypothetical protein QVD17_14827 [Tagetes erecta]
MQPVAHRHGPVLDHACGTHGYVDPAYLRSESVSHKSDVYSFGVILFEVLCRRKEVNQDKLRLLADVTVKSHDANIKDIIHPGLRIQMDLGSLKIFSKVAYCCLNEQRSQRPNIDAVIVALDQSLKLQLAHESSLVRHEQLTPVDFYYWKNFEAKISDFGLSKFDNTWEVINPTHIAGTQVYLDPEYDRTGKFKIESDVYSFGVVLFELLSGRLAYDPVYTKENANGLGPIVRGYFIEKRSIKELVDPNLEKESISAVSKGLNPDSLNTFTAIGYRCLAEKQSERPTMKTVIEELEKSLKFQTQNLEHLRIGLDAIISATDKFSQKSFIGSEKQADRPTMEVIIEELQKALKFQETRKDGLRISFEDIVSGTQAFSEQIGQGRLGKVYKGEILRANGPTPIAVKRYDENNAEGEKEFLTEVEILFEYKHENIIGLVGYCDENNEKLLVYEYASNLSLDKHLKNASLTWTDRLKIGIDVAMALEFLHGGGSPVVHKNLKSSTILLNEDWKAKVSDFGLSTINPIYNEIDFVVDDAWGIPNQGLTQHTYLTKETDIYSLGVILCEMMCGTTAVSGDNKDEGGRYVVDLVKRQYEGGNVRGLVFEGIKDQIKPKSLISFLKIVYECLHDEIEKRPTAGDVALQLKKAL